MANEAQTEALYRHAKRRMPGGTQLLSKRPEMFAYPRLAHFAFDHKQANNLKTIYTTLLEDPPSHQGFRRLL
jgi:hypothetical protein